MALVIPEDNKVILPIESHKLVFINTLNINMFNRYMNKTIWARPVCSRVDTGAWCTGNTAGNIARAILPQCCLFYVACSVARSRPGGAWAQSPEEYPGTTRSRKTGTPGNARKYTRSRHRWLEEGAATYPVTTHPGTKRQRTRSRLTRARQANLPEHETTRA